MKKCLICNTVLKPFISFGQMPIANGFLDESEFKDEYFYELQAAFCPVCAMVQLVDRVSRDRMFHDHYAFFSSTSTRMASHFEKFAEEVMRDYLHTSDPFVLEIGSNDGILLKSFAKSDIRHLGIEPSLNVAHCARENGVNTSCRFFDENAAEEIQREFGQADVFLGANVMCHLPYLGSVMRGIKRLLKPGGLLIFEDPYLGDILEKTSFDQIYDEHAFYFCLTSLAHLLKRYGFEVVDVRPQEVHGGSMRYYVGHQNARQPSSSVAALKEKERSMGLDRIETFMNFKYAIQRSHDELKSLLESLKRQGKRVVGYGATSKSTTVTNFCGIDRGVVEYISDTTPLKHNKFSPGTHIPIRSYDAFKKDYPDYALLFAWNHAKEIMAKEKAFSDVGGQWIVYVPKVKVLNSSMLKETLSI
jgi:methylation protein EvaC